MPLPGSKICETIKKNGKRCRAAAVKGYDHCITHGGAAHRANTKHGLYRKYPLEGLDDIIEEQRANPKLMDMREQTILASSALAYTMRKIQSRIDQAKVWKPKKDKKGKIFPNQEPPSTDIEQKELEALVALSDRVSASIERAAKVGLITRYLFHIDTVTQMMEEWNEILKGFIPSPEKRRKFMKLLSIRSAQIAKEHAEISHRTQRALNPPKTADEWRESFGDKSAQIIDVEED